MPLCTCCGSARAFHAARVLTSCLAIVSDGGGQIPDHPPDVLERYHCLRRRILDLWELAPFPIAITVDYNNREAKTALHAVGLVARPRHRHLLLGTADSTVQGLIDQIVRRPNPPPDIFRSSVHYPPPCLALSAFQPTGARLSKMSVASIGHGLSALQRSRSEKKGTVVCHHFALYIQKDCVLFQLIFRPREPKERVVFLLVLSFLVHFACTTSTQTWTFSSCSSSKHTSRLAHVYKPLGR